MGAFNRVAMVANRLTLSEATGPAGAVPISPAGRAPPAYSLASDILGRIYRGLSINNPSNPPSGIPAVEAGRRSVPNDGFAITQDPDYDKTN